MKQYFLDEIAEMRTKIENSTDENEIRALGEKITKAQAQVAKIEAEEARKAQGGFNPMATFGARSNGADESIEKRVAFANFVTRGVIPTEMRASTATGDVGVAIPENLLNTIIEKIETIGTILSLVTRTAFPVGQSIPVDGVKPTASWVAEGAGSTPQKKSGMTSIVFGGFKLRCEIRMTHEVTVQTLPAFEALFVKQVSEAMVKAIESKIVSADNGTGAPTGILYNAADNDKKVTVTEIGYATLCDAEAELPQEYEAGAKWFMSKKTFMKFVGMVDSNGQPVARVNYGIGGKPERILLGRDVVLCPYLPDFATDAGTFAFLFDATDYVLNTNYDLGIQRKQDWDTEDQCIKSVMSCDGKVIDRTSLVKLVTA